MVQPVKYIKYKDFKFYSILNDLEIVDDDDDPQ